MAGKLTTHVLDTANGCAAAGMTIELWAIAVAGPSVLLKTTQTNADGRTDAALLNDQDIKTGWYELIFYVGDYFAQFSEPPTEVSFLGKVPIRFGISDPTSHYHVPLLVSPWSYTTYRGS